MHLHDRAGTLASINIKSCKLIILGNKSIDSEAAFKMIYMLLILECLWTVFQKYLHCFSSHTTHTWIPFSIPNHTFDSG